MRNRAEAVGALVLMLLGAGVALGSLLHYRVGTASQMGPGYFPLILGAITCAIGAMIFLTTHSRRSEVPHIAWRPLIAILAGIVAFGAVVTLSGLIPAVFVAFVIAALADRQFEAKSSLAIAALASVAIWLVFGLGLQLRVPAFFHAA